MGGLLHMEVCRRLQGAVRRLVTSLIIEVTTASLALTLLSQP